MWCCFDGRLMQVKIDIIENPMPDDPDRALGRILIMMPAGISTGELDARQTTFDADAVDAVPDAAYDSDGLINLDELSTISHSALDDLMQSVRYQGDADGDN